MTTSVAAAAILSFAPGAAGGPASGLVLAPPPDGRVYHAAYPNFRGSEDHVRARYIRHFERLAGKPIAWTYFSNNWTRRIHFPFANMRRIHSTGSVPFVRLMARSDFDEGGPDERYTMQRIIDGDFDSQLAAWGAAAGSLPYPLLVEFGTEANGFWFPWNGAWNGKGRTDGYGDPSVPDGPERFVNAYRHLHDVITAAGATNLTWFWHVDAGGYPRTAWNRIANYWPGDAYVDWIGVSDYGPLTPSDGWGSGFAPKLARVYPQLTALSAKPIAVLEYGARQGRPKARWIRRAIRAVASGRFPRVRGLACWHEGWQNGDGSYSRLYIDSDPRSLRAYRRGVANSVFTGRAAFSQR